MISHWSVHEADEGHVEKIAKEYDLPVAIAKVLYLRGIRSDVSIKRFLSRSIQDMTHPFQLSGMREAATRIAEAIEQGQGILIHGDFDADGITSTAVLYLFLRDLQANVHFYIPNRLYEGHGVSMKALDLSKEKNVRLMITCDCGSSNAKEIESFFQQGVETIITDHHYVGDSTSTNAIIVNPRAAEDSGHEGLAGVGVAFMVITAVRAVLRERGFFQARKEPNLREYLDIVALGTVADMAPLLGQNRILVSEGLNQLVASRRPGVMAMKSMTGLKDTSVLTEDIGFKLAPRINAAARLGHADEALQLLISNDSQKAHRLANQLEGWNTERKAIQEKMLRICVSQAEVQAKEGKSCIVISSAEFHSGISGLVAQKLAELFYLPVFLFAIEGELAKASARSRSGVDLHFVLDECSELFLQYGGHEEAGGCTMPTKNLPQFRTKVEEVISRLNRRNRTLVVDAELSLELVDESFLKNLFQLRPFGMGNPQPLFAAKGEIAGMVKKVGENHMKATIVARDGRPFDTIGFGLWNDTTSALRSHVDVVFTLEENLWQGRKTTQLNLRSIRSAI